MRLDITTAQRKGKREGGREVGTRQPTDSLARNREHAGRQLSLQQPQPHHICDPSHELLQLGESSSAERTRTGERNSFQLGERPKQPSGRRAGRYEIINETYGGRNFRKRLI